MAWKGPRPRRLAMEKVNVLLVISVRVCSIFPLGFLCFLGARHWDFMNTRVLMRVYDKKYSFSYIYFCCVFFQMVSESLVSSLPNCFFKAVTLLPPPLFVPAGLLQKQSFKITSLEGPNASTLGSRFSRRFYFRVQDA